MQGIQMILSPQNCSTGVTHRAVASMGFLFLTLNIAGAQELSVAPGQAADENYEVLRTLENKASSSLLSKRDGEPSIFGPLTYRLSTLQGLASDIGNMPFIVRTRPEDGLPNDRILGGVPAGTTEFPWQVALLNSRYGNMFCSGSHLGDGWILTAAHCFLDEFGQKLSSSDVLVLYGTNNLLFGGDRVSLETEPILHEGYDTRTKANDIALLKIVPRQDVAAVDLITPAEEDTLLRTPLEAVVSGWGRVTEGGAISTSLLKVEIPVIDSTECRNSYPNLNQAQLCAGGKGEDSCQGDSGGPLSVALPSKAMLLGIVSFGQGCGREGFPGVYTRVARYGDWIQAYTGVTQRVAEQPAD